jgi:hypothetical protein
MAPLPVIADTYRCALHYVATGGAYAVNVIHVRSNGSTPDGASVGAQLVAAWPNHMMTGIPGAVAMDYIDVTPLDGVSPTSRTLTGSAGEFVGEQTGDWLAQVATIVKLQTDFRGRSHRGRVYRPFAAEETCSDGFFDLANVALLQTAWDTFQANLAAGADVLLVVVASYKLATADDVTSFVAEHALATQRRRQSRLR